MSLWFQHDHDIDEKPEFLRIKRASGLDKLLVRGALSAWFEQVNKHGEFLQDGTDRGVMRGYSLLDLVDLIGLTVDFWQIVAAEGWIEESDDGLIVPKFAERFGKLAAKQKRGDPTQPKRPRGRPRKDRNVPDSKAPTLPEMDGHSVDDQTPGNLRDDQDVRTDDQRSCDEQSGRGSMPHGTTDDPGRVSDPGVSGQSTASVGNVSTQDIRQKDPYAPMIGRRVSMFDGTNHDVGTVTGVKGENWYVLWDRTQIITSPLKCHLDVLPKETAGVITPSRPTATQQASQFDRLATADLSVCGTLLAWISDCATKSRPLVVDDEFHQVRVIAAGQRATSKNVREPMALFKSIVGKRRWTMLESDDIDRAKSKLRTYRQLQANRQEAYRERAGPVEPRAAPVASLVLSGFGDVPLDRQDTRNEQAARLAKWRPTTAKTG